MKGICPVCRNVFDMDTERCPTHGIAIVENVSGTVLAGNYKLEQLIGVGGMGSSVWRANQTKINRPVAVKLLPPATEIHAKRFAREARIASHLNHPNIVIIHDYGQSENNQLYLVMELLEGVTLQREIKRCGTLPVKRALHISDQVLRGLEHAHSKHVVHRDLKPGNLFLTNRNNDPDYIKVLDFGLAKSFAEDNDNHIAGQSPDELNVTGTEKVLCGTPNFMAVEQLFCTELDARTDVYAMGVVLFLMLTGQLPFVASNAAELYQKIISQPVPLFDDILPSHQVPNAIESVIRKALSKEAAERYPDAQAMRIALAEAAGEEANRPDKPKRTNHWSKTDNFAAINTTVSTDDNITSVQEQPASATNRITVMILLALIVGVSIWNMNSNKLKRVPASQSPTNAQQVETSSSGQNAADKASDKSGQTSLSASNKTSSDKLKTQNKKDVANRAAPKDNKEKTAASILVKITSVPSGANVTYQGVQVGITPFNLFLERKNHAFKLSKSGFLAKKISINLKGTRGATHVENIRLTSVTPTNNRIKKSAFPNKKKMELLEPAWRNRKSSRHKSSTSPPKDQPKRKIKIQLLDEEKAREISSPKGPKKKPARKVHIETLGD